MSKLEAIFNKKQIEVLRCSVKEEPKILVCSGAKRAGKTFILNFAMLKHMRKYAGMGVSFIIGGATSASIRRNVLNDWESILKMDIKLNKEQGFELFGNMVYCFGGENADSWKAVRGFTAAGAFLNEGTALHDTFVKETISRCSFDGARVFIDTNPENPMHSVKVDYVDNDGQLLEDGRLNIKAFHFQLEDNTFLPKDYVESIKKSTPSGMFYDRDILGLWVNAEGIVYKDFNKDIHVIDDIPEDEEIIEYIIGVDWGFEHYGSLGVIGYSTKDNYYLIEEHTKKNMYVESYWLELAISLKEKYMILNKEPLFIVDSARSEYKNLFLDNNLDVVNATKKVIEGIEYVASLYKQNKLFILESGIDRFLTEIHSYVWHKNIGSEEKVKKTMDDCMDAIRYAIYTHMLMTR